MVMADRPKCGRERWESGALALPCDGGVDTHSMIRKSGGNHLALAFGYDGVWLVKAS